MLTIHDRKRRTPNQKSKTQSSSVATSQPTGMSQRMQQNPQQLTPNYVIYLQRAVGNQGIASMKSSISAI